MGGVNPQIDQVKSGQAITAVGQNQLIDVANRFNNLSTAGASSVYYSDDGVNVMSIPPDQRFRPRGTPEPYKGIFYRAYWILASTEEGSEHDADEIVPPDEPYDDEKMYLYETWDWLRFAYTPPS